MKHRLILFVGWSLGQPVLSIAEPRAAVECEVDTEADQAAQESAVLELFRQSQQEMKAKEQTLPKRVMAIMSADSGKKEVLFFGEGNYVGDHRITSEAIGAGPLIAARNGLNPRIDLDSGEHVWGAECHWGPLEAMQKRFEGYTFVPVSIDAMRAQATQAKVDTFSPGKEVVNRVELGDSAEDFVPRGTRGIVTEMRESEAVVAFDVQGKSISATVMFEYLERAVDQAPPDSEVEAAEPQAQA